MGDAEKVSLEAIGRFVEASEKVRFEAQGRRKLYDCVEPVLIGTADKVVEIASCTRARWKTDNESFNVLKNRATTGPTTSVTGRRIWPGPLRP
ncbi:MAG: hypothetical protein WAN35_16485 [Terracidiphilus sp.]